MGHFRFRRSVGTSLVRFNVSKTGTSITTGVPGAHLNVPLLGGRKRKPMITLGMPGTGLSYRQPLGGSTRKQQAQTPQQGFENNYTVVIVFGIMVVLWFLSHLH